jgi:hypothetical protein
VPEVAPPSLEESSEVVCKDGDLLCTISLRWHSPEEQESSDQGGAVNFKLSK